MALKRFLRCSSRLTVLVAALALISVVALPARTNAAGGTGNEIANYPGGFTAQQQANLYQIAKDTWSFYQYGVGVDPHTYLPLDNITAPNGTITARGTYTSPTNIGVYLWSIVAAMDLRFISRSEARDRIAQTLNTIRQLRKWNPHNSSSTEGFLLKWYDTTTGHWTSGPGSMTDLQNAPIKGAEISTVDEGWYASGLIVVRQALPELSKPATDLLNAMDFSIFFDTRDQSKYIDAGQLYGDYFADQGPSGWHYGTFNTEPRITQYIGIGERAMPGDVWWRSWRTLPSSWTWQGQIPQPQPDNVVTYTDPQSGKQFPVVEDHYTYPGTDLTYVPSWGGSMFEALMPNLVVPETSWGPRSFGLNDRNYAQMQILYATKALHYPVWGLSPSSTPDDTGGYDAYGAGGRVFPDGQHTATCGGCYDEYAVTPHASFLALDVLPQDAYSNIQTLRAQYSGVYGPYGFYDAVNPTTGSVGHRYLDLDQSMIMAGLDNALDNRQLQRYFARDPISWAAQTYLGMETMSIH